MPAQAGVHRAASLPGEGIAASQNTADLADRHAALQPPKDTADFIDISLGIQAVTTVGADGLNQSITAFPGTKGHGVDTGQA
ncbi:hypothetical protein D3C76_1752250 [compost metagenome]